MGILSNRVGKSKIKPGDHIYTYRAAFLYSHHGIYAGGYQVIHFTTELNENSNTSTFSGSSFSSLSIPSCCPNILCIPHCGIRQPGSGVVLSCLDCFLGNGSLHFFEYGVSAFNFLSKLRGGSCTTAKSDPSNRVLYRAMYLLLNGFGKYNLIGKNCEDFALYCKTSLLKADNVESGISGQAASFLNGFGKYNLIGKNCEDFALYCKTILLKADNVEAGTSGQAASFLAVPVAAITSFPLKFLMRSPVAMAVTTAGYYHVCRYTNDIGVRTDTMKVPVEMLHLLRKYQDVETDACID